MMTEPATNSHTPGPQDGVVTLRINATYKDKSIQLERLAPRLPPGFVWHHGMCFDDGGDVTLEVQAVVIKPNGSGFVYLDDQVFAGRWVDSEIEDWRQTGWEIVST